MANTPNVSIQVNHRPNGAITTHICQTSNNNSVRVRPRSDAFPALSTVSVPDAQWIKPLPKESKPKVSKVAPAPVLPVQNSSNDFPSLSKTEQKTKKSSSVTVPVGASASTTVAPPVEQTDSKKETGKNKKKKSKANNSNNISTLESSSSQNKPTSAWEDKSPKKGNSNSKEARENGVIKKRTELKIDSLQISEPSSSNKSEDFPVLGASKPPPGFTVHAPPGFAANDLTFTNSSGQSFSILPSNQFSPPPNFSQRNKKLVESFMSSLESNDAIIEFKNLSSMFRNNLIPADRYYDQCKKVMGNDFGKIFPELLVLLPDIEKQQELYVIFSKNSGNKRGLDVCATCRQVVTSADLRNHLNTHSLQNHFPNLTPKEVNSVWKK